MPPLALVTGASSGIGRACATHLAALGFHVLAGVRNEADAPPGTEPVRLDVTSEDDIAAAAERVGAELAALVNNAGIAVTGPIEGVPVEEWRRQIEVNFLGQVAVTRALLPALLRARGRIVNMSSIGGRVADPAVRAVLGLQVRARGGDRRAAARGRPASASWSQRRAGRRSPRRSGARAPRTATALMDAMPDRRRAGATSR